MKDQEVVDLCADLIEIITKKLLENTKSESYTIKIVKISMQRAIENNKEKC